jgi:hypothetical protein
MLLATVAWLRGKKIPGFLGKGPLIATLLLGSLVTATQWSGVMLMVNGWNAGR